MRVVRVIPCICSPNWEEEQIDNGYYGMPQLRVYGGSDRYFDAHCPKCGRGGLLQYKSAYLALKEWNEMQEQLRRVEGIIEGEE